MQSLRKIGLPGLAVGGLLMALALYGLNAWLGNLNQDEGWYLYAALQRAAGRLPYRDFFFSQGPFMPRFYGIMAPLWEPAGLLGGRLFTALLGVSGGVLTALLAAGALPRRRRLAGGLTAFLLTAGNVYHSYFTTIPKTYALASLLILLGMLALGQVGKGGRRHGFWWAAAGGAGLALAAGTRLSLGAALPVAGIYLLCRSRRLGLAWVGFGLGGGLVLALLLGPVIATAGDQFMFANFFHSTRGSGGLLFAAGSVSRLARNYLPLVAVALAAAALASLAPSSAMAGQRPEGTTGQGADAVSRSATPLSSHALTLLVFGAVFAVHLLSPFPYDDYQVPVMPLLAAAVAAAFWRALPCGGAPGSEGRLQFVLTGALLAWCAVCAGASTINEDWLIAGKDRLWVVKKAQPDLALLRQTAREITGLTQPGDMLLTQDTYLAVEAQRRVPPGFEMGPFSYFAALSDEEARRYRVLNRNLLQEAIAGSAAPVAAFSGYGLAMEAPAMTPVPEADRAALLATLAAHYDPWRTIPLFGQEHTELRIWKRK